MNHSIYQEEIFKFFGRNPNNNGMINAVAGSGKTYTMVKGLDYSDKNKSALVCAFNKIIQTEFQSRINRPNTTVQTYNAFGYRICRNAFKNTEMDIDKTNNILMHCILKGKDEDTFKKMAPVARRLVSIAKASLIDSGRQLSQNLDEICAEYDIELPRSIPDAAAIIIATFEECIHDTYHLDFDDQLYYPWKYRLPVPNFDLVLVDEYQDTSPIQSWLMSQAMGQNGAQIVAGDPWQAIYSWRGATPDAMLKFKDSLKAEELPLSICYRCPKLVIDEAKKIVPHIEAAPEAEAGIVETINKDKMEQMVDQGDFILSRTTAPLIGTCLELIRKGKRAQVRGREIGTDLVNLINRLDAGRNNIDEFLIKLGEYERIQSERLNKMNKEQQLIALQDKVHSLNVFAEISSSVTDMVNRISTMFSDNTSVGITCMTVHKSKGLQANRVFIIRPDQLPMKKNDPEEMRIKYVALTRAQKELYFIQG